MAEVCVSKNLNIDGGVLALEPWSVPHHVFDTTYNSVGDGSFTQLTTLPGKLMIDSGIQTWTNPSTMNSMVLLRIQRAYRDWVTSNPNAVQIRDRYTYAIGGADPRVPDPSSVYTGHSGASGDTGANFNGVPDGGLFYEWEDPTLIEDWIGPIPPGEDLKVWYKCYLWTPPPWSNNANDNNPIHSANVRSSRIQMMAFPTQDEGVVG